MTRYYQPLPNEWEQTGLIVSSLLAPYSRDKVPKPSDFMPIERPPNHHEQDMSALLKLRAALGDG